MRLQSPIGHALALPEEVRAGSEEPDEEQRLFVIMEKLTGISMHDVFAQQFKVFA